MAGWAAVAVASYGAKEGHDARSDAKKEQNKTNAKLVKKEAENKKQKEIDSVALATSTGAAKRIAHERENLRRGAGKGRSGSAVRRTGSLG